MHGLSSFCEVRDVGRTKNPYSCQELVRVVVWKDNLQFIRTCVSRVVDFGSDIDFQRSGPAQCFLLLTLNRHDFDLAGQNRSPGGMPPKVSRHSRRD
jgi:hypothetical protein